MGRPSRTRELAVTRCSPLRHRLRERTLLLYCPEQGGWQKGEWCRWVSTADIETVLEPTHWTEVPPEPKGG
jgi:hypothetical protein